MSESNEVLSEPTLERRTRRRFSAAEKQRLLAEADALPHGEQGAWLRRNGLYAAQLSQWRKALADALGRLCPAAVEITGVIGVGELAHAGTGRLLVA